MAKKLSQEKVIKQFKEKHGDKYGYEKVKYIGANEKVIIYCNKCKEYFEQSANKHKRGQGCPFCSGNKVGLNNMLSIVRPDLIKYFKNIEEANECTIGSNKKVMLKCIDCGEEKEMFINNLTRYGFSCPMCSDGITIPEKFCIELLNQLNLSFSREKTFSWSNNKRYDFYIESLNTIIETHGRQHYQDIERGRTLEEEKNNDLLKEKLAKENGIEYYNIVDCRKSDFNFLRENFIKSLQDISDLSKVDWKLIWDNCQINLLNDIWKAWDNKKEEENTSTIAEEFNLSKPTIIDYLKRGNSIGKCTYNPKEELIKNSSNLGSRFSKKVYQFSLEDVFIKDYNSISEAGRELGIAGSGIGACCNKKQKTAGGFKWSFEKPPQ